MTSGAIAVTPVRIRTRASLEQIHGHLTVARYEGKSGWGSVFDGTDDLLGKVVLERPRGGRPEAVLHPERYPSQLRARLYWDEPDSSLVRAFGEFDPARTMRLRAADVTVAETSIEGELVGLLGERNHTRLNTYVIPELAQAIEAVDPSVVVARDNTPFGFGDDDFFRWVLFRATHSPSLNSDLSIEFVRAMANQDAAFRATRLSRGVELDRPELLALVVGSLNRFGPAKFVVWSEELKLRASLEVTGAGEFTIYRGDTEYEYELGEDPLPSDEEGARLLQDVAFEVLPELKRLHNADSDWRDGDREAFREEARQALRAALDRL